MSTHFIGSKISLISNAEIRYEGILYSIDQNESTVALAKVKTYGTEDRPTERPVPPRDDVYEYIIFRGSDIKDLHVSAPPPPVSLDPAIVHSSNVLPENFNSNVENNQQMSPQLQTVRNFPQQQTQQPYPPPGLMPHPQLQQHQSPQQMNFPNQPCPIERPGPPGFTNKGEKTSEMGGGGYKTLEFTNNNLNNNNNNLNLNNKMAQQPQQVRHQTPNNMKNGVVSSKQHPPFYSSHPSSFYQPHLHHPPPSLHQQQYFSSAHRGLYQRGGVNSRGGMGGGGRVGRGLLNNINNTMNRLPSQNNNNIRNNFSGFKFDDEFDFERSNAQFDKEKIEKELKEKLTITNKDKNPKSKNGDLTNDNNNNNNNNNNNSEQPPPQQATQQSHHKQSHQQQQQIFYDKSKSFFDNISCDALDKNKSNKTSWKEERKLNSETFGISNLHNHSYRPSHFYRGRGHRGRPMTHYRGGWGGPPIRGAPSSSFQTRPRGEKNDRPNKQVEPLKS